MAALMSILLDFLSSPTKAVYPPTGIPDNISNPTGSRKLRWRHVNVFTLREPELYHDGGF
jgi:hypothetical protein